jgi:hypothetical protein
MEKVVRVRRDDNQGPGGSLNVKCLFLKARFTGLFLARGGHLCRRIIPPKLFIVKSLDF